MHIVLTHPNADFDAIASLLGAWRVYPEAVPVLPPTLNRNVRDFVTLYESKLPFVHQHELDQRPIEQVTLVDTQVLPQIKNLRPGVKLHIIDHHDPHHPLPPQATLTYTATGATTTLLVERISEAALRLGPLEATLLLLGIYEDTGAFTYGNTTSRDLHAAAWLLSEGHAHLDLVRAYLNYAMSEAQKSLYDQIVENLETLLIHGHTILIGLAQVDHYVEEVSVLAARLRELYQPDGLFILVDMTDHIQLVARSVNDEINVGRISELLGGGGHARAAAALVRGKSLAELKQELVSVLGSEVQPAVTVSQIMSKGARTLTPADTVRHAAQMMDRYGHEGFPVVDQASREIVGILSRREVDKALRHKLDGAVIEQFMTKGQFFVQPNDGIDEVQKLMTEYKIGQVPVVDPGTGDIIGIVTRTDLINLWQLAEARRTSHLNLAESLAGALSKTLFDLIRDAGELADRQGDTLYLVGGFVRDLLLTMSAAGAAAKEKVSPRFDLDLVVEGDAVGLARALAKRYGGRVHSHSRFGTAKWLLETPVRFNREQAPQPVELTSLDFVTARTEFYRHPSALPEVEQSSIRQDLHRRDFTINTLALRLTPDHFGELLDFFGGQDDLEARLIRVLHSLSFVEDPTRMLRAARLLARLEFDLEARTAELLNNALDLLPRVSGERITNELELIFRERHPAPALRQLDDLGILAAIHPGLMVDELLLAAIHRLRTGLTGTPWADIAPEFVHYIGLMTFWLAGDELEALVERLNLRTAQRSTLQQVYRLKRQAAAIAAAEQPSALCHLLDSTNRDARLMAWLALDDAQARRQLVHYEVDLKDMTPLIDGNILKREFKLSPGPIFKTILEALRDARVDGQVRSLEDERVLVEEMLASLT